MPALFIDTGAFLSRYLERDQHHDKASAAWATLANKACQPVTSNFVLDETFTLLARRSGYPFAAERARNILASTALTTLRPDAEDEIGALRWFEKFANHEVSFTDCVSFTLMQRHRIVRAFTFDRDFVDAGYEVWVG